MYDVTPDYGHLLVFTVQVRFSSASFRTKTFTSVKLPNIFYSVPENNSEITGSEDVVVFLIVALVVFSTCTPLKTTGLINLIISFLDTCAFVSRPAVKLKRFFRSHVFTFVSLIIFPSSGVSRGGRLA